MYEGKDREGITKLRHFDLMGQAQFSEEKKRVIENKNSYFSLMDVLQLNEKMTWAYGKYMMNLGITSKTLCLEWPKCAVIYATEFASIW